MANEENKSPKPRFNPRKHRRSFAPPKGATPSAGKESILPHIGAGEERIAPKPPKTEQEPKREPEHNPAQKQNRNRPGNNPRKNKKPYHKNRHHNREEKKPLEETVLSELSKEASLPEQPTLETEAAPFAAGEEVVLSPCESCTACEECPRSEEETVPEEEVPRVTIVGVRFKEGGKIYYFDPAGMELTKGISVIVETSRGIECGKVAVPNRQVKESSLTSPLKPLVRIANEQDLKKAEQLRKMEVQAKEVWNKKLQSHKLDMALVDVEYTFDSQKLIFYFTAEGRVDFRDFVKDLATVFKTRIELRQIGVRDEAKQIGGLGVCGRPFCCKTFLDDFQQVSIKMAKEQNLSLNSVKISGTCGRLMCCLRYENEIYEQESKKTPRVDMAVMTPDGRGVVTENNVLNGTCKVRLDKKSDLAPTEYHRDQLKVLGKVNRQGRLTQQDSEEEEKND